jgi:pteridine reductase
MQRMGHPEEVAKLVQFLIDDADYITGQVIAVDGGRSVMF